MDGALAKFVMETAVKPWANAVGLHLQGAGSREAPIDTGQLRGSVTYEVVEHGRNVEVIVTAGTVYAARQHEEVTWQHPRGGKAKYLSDPLKANANRYENALAVAVTRALATYAKAQRDS